MAILYSSVKYQAAYERCGCVFSLQGKNYNITSMESADDTARFTVEHNGYMFSYNPCRSFHFLSPPSKGDCQDDMAMCYWLSDRMYEKIAYQSTAKCGFNAKYNLPMLQYTGDIYIKKTTVLLKCEPSIKQPNFTVVDDNDRAEFVFELTHECACPELCVVSPSIHTTKDPTDTTGHPHDTTDVTKIVVWTVSGFLLLIVIIVIGLKRRDIRARWQGVMRRRQNDEEQPILGGNRDGVVEETRNDLQNGASGGGEVASGSDLVRPSNGSSMFKKDDINKTLKNLSKSVQHA